MDWIAVISNVGFPIVLILMVGGVLGLALRQALPWMAQNVILPVATSHIHLIDALERAVQVQAQAIQSQAESAKQMADSVTNLETLMRQHHEETKRLGQEAEKGSFCRKE